MPSLPSEMIGALAPLRNCSRTGSGARWRLCCGGPSPGVCGQPRDNGLPVAVGCHDLSSARTATSWPTGAQAHQGDTATELKELGCPLGYAMAGDDRELVPG